MIQVLSNISALDSAQWSALSQECTASWFQTREAYDFYASLKDEMRPFCFAAEEDGVLVGVLQGYVTYCANPIKQMLTRRAIVVGGPMLREDISDAALEQLLLTAKRELRKQIIYIETRNFSDYSRWRTVFERCGFDYKEHLNFHVHTSTPEEVEANLGKSRKRDIRTTVREGAVAVMSPSIEQVREYYAILKNLYTTKVKTPLSPLSFFEKLFEQPASRFLLVEYQGKIIGGTVCVCLPGKAVYEWYVCGMDGVFDHIFPSSYATYLGIRYAAENGYPIFDMMGAGTPQEAYGVRDFKARFGGELVEHGRYLHVCKPLLYRIGVLGVKILKKQ